MDEHLLQQQIQEFIRRFGLLEQEHTPCHYPLSPSQAHALQVLGQNDALTLNQLAARLSLEKSTVSRLVNNLVERNWVERSTNPENRREIHLTLTEQGFTIFRAIQASAATKYQAIWKRIPLEKRTQIIDTLTELNTLLQEEDHYEA